LYPLHQGTPLALVEQVIPAFVDIYPGCGRFQRGWLSFSASESIFVYLFGP
jgi:hypothetical protein